MSTTEQTLPDPAHADIGIVCALSIEMAVFLDRCLRVRKYKGGEFVFRGGLYDEARLVCVESGMGFARARRATQSMIEAHTPDWVLSCGFSGALLPEMKVGNIVVANTIIDTHGHELKIDLDLAPDTKKGLFIGRFLTVDKLVRTVKEKQELAQEYDPIAVDLESLAVAQVAKEQEKRFMAVRVISDDLSADLPPEVLSIIGQTGSMRIGAALGAVWKRPASVKEMWQLRETALLAARRLATFLEGVVTQLYESI